MQLHLRLPRSCTTLTAVRFRAANWVDRTVQKLHATISYVGLASELAQLIDDPVAALARIDEARQRDAYLRRPKSELEERGDSEVRRVSRRKSRSPTKRAPVRGRPTLRIVVNNEFAGGCTP
jgi:hypothetical protein